MSFDTKRVRCEQMSSLEVKTSSHQVNMSSSVGAYWIDAHLLKDKNGCVLVPTVFVGVCPLRYKYQLSGNHKLHNLGSERTVRSEVFFFR
jgi:hypothetical protein